MIHFRPMTVADIAPITTVITAHDEDDGAAARQSFTRAHASPSAGLTDYIVLEHHGRPVGVTGCTAIPATEGAFWVTWTYLDRELRGQGFGSKLVKQAIDQARQRNARKLFLKLSDYQDPESGDVYGAARRCYLGAGFRDELVIRDYYDAGENLTVMGLDLQPASMPRRQAVPIADEWPKLELDRWFEIAETDGAYAFSWRVKPAASALGGALARSGGSAFNAKSLASGLAVMRERGARAVFLSFPSNLPAIVEPLQAAGFDRIGELPDYYAPGLHEVHFAHYLK